MPEKFPIKKESIEKKESSLQKEAEASEVEKFLDKEGEILAAYGMRGDITLERGKNWAFDLKNKKLFYDPNFFAERGYNLKETLFATTHELMAHYAELLRDPKQVLKEAERYCATPHLHFLHNIFEDVLGNRRIVAELPFLEETRTNLYKEKLFPVTDYKDNALHVQFAYGFIREAMVPGESVEMASDAREALENLRRFGKDKLDILNLVTTPTIEPEDRFNLMRRIVEPVYLKLYKEDLKKEEEKAEKEAEKEQKKESEAPSQKTEAPQKEGEKKAPASKGETEAQKRSREEKKKRAARREAQKQANEKFKEQYGVYEKSHPKPITPKNQEKIKEKLKEIVSQQGGVPSLDKSILEQWARERGLAPEDVVGYRREYQEIAPLVSELREVFKKIVSRRLQERWKFAPQLKKEGEELEESTLTETYIESRAGAEPRAFREIERRKREQKGYGVLDMTLVSDLSSSMTEGGKLKMERKSEMLFLESLADFQKEIEAAELESSIPLGLEVRTESRAFGDFGDAELKSLSTDLTEKDRISIWKKLHKADGGTPDYLSLESVLKSITPKQEKDLKEKLRRKVVIVLTDGDSQDFDRVQRALKKLRNRGVITIGLGMTESSASIKNTYKPDAEVIADIRNLPGAIQKTILKYTQDL